MPLYDKEKILKIVSELRKSVRRLQSLRNLSQDKFIKDQDLCTTPLKSIGLISLKSCAVCFD